MGQENVMPGENPQAPLRDENGEPMSPNDMTIPEAPNIPVTPEEAIQRHLAMKVRDQMGEDKKREGEADLQALLTPDGQGGGLAEGEPGPMPMQEAPGPVTGADRGMSSAGGTQDFMPDPQGGQRLDESRDEYLERERANEPAWAKRDVLPALDTASMQGPPPGGAMFFEGEEIAPAPASIDEIKALIKKNARAALDGREDEGFGQAVADLSEILGKQDAFKAMMAVNEKERDRYAYGQGDTAKGELDELRKADIRQRIAKRKKDMRINDEREFRTETTKIRERMNVRGWDENKEGIENLARYEDMVMNGNSAEQENAYRLVLKMSMPGVATDQDRADLNGVMDKMETLRNWWSKTTGGEMTASVRAKMAQLISGMQDIRMRSQARVYKDFKVSQAGADAYGPRQRAYTTLEKSEFDQYKNTPWLKRIRRVEQARLTGGYTRGRDDNPALAPLDDPATRAANKGDPSAKTVSGGIKNLLRKR